MASGGQSKHRKSYDLKFKLDAVDFDDLACIDRSRVPHKRRVPVQAGGQSKLYW